MTNISYQSLESLISMQSNKTQQFAKFFIKDQKIKSDKFKSEKSDLTDLNTSNIT